ncbi:MAG: T9SS type A sorting domain-containing protein [Fibrobacteres bacterium]|nr:T9SS type A sorting domain-containing protein [Fibrobacterota bacterium]
MSDKRSKLLVLLILAAHLFSSNINAQTSGFTVPTGHPRLFWSSEKLQLARTWYSTHPFTPSASDPFANAFKYVLAGDTACARVAVNWLMNLQLPAGQVLPTAIGCDECRWEGETAILVYDWCYDRLSPSQRSTLISRWNTWLSNVNQQDWGGVGMEGNNYYWGNVRNSLEWGIATFGENTSAQSFLDNALNTRWRNSFMPYADTGNAKGGALGEGMDYGCTMLSYPIIPFSSITSMGRNIWNESTFFKAALVALLYSTTPSKMIDGSSRYFSFFPYNETEVEDIIHTRNYYGDFMQMAANMWESIPLGQYARRWVNVCTPRVTSFIQSVNQTGRERSFSSLPLDYYAPGLGYLYSRTSWDTTATAVHIQMKMAEGVGHNHVDWSHFQIFRKGRWLTKESSGYAVDITGVEGSALDVGRPDGHNTIFAGPPLGQSIAPLETRGLARGWQKSPAVVKRLERGENFSFAAVDLSDCYKSDNYDLFDNKYVSKVVREYLFIRPLEVLLVMDRVLASSEKMAAAGVVKSALVHFPVNPVLVDSNHVLAVNGDQALQLTTLVPAKPTYNVQNEGTNGQYRLLVSTSGSAQSYLVNMFHAKDASGTNITSTVVDEGTSYRINISHPVNGSAVVVFQKGDTSIGGSFGYAPGKALPVASPLLQRVQGITVNDSGPAWEALSSKTETAALTSKTVMLQVRPNPAGAIVSFTFTVSTITKARLSVYTADGRLVSAIADRKLSPGVHSYKWNAKNAAKGLYLARYENGSRNESVRFIVY